MKNFNRMMRRVGKLARVRWVGRFQVTARINESSAHKRTVAGRLLLFTFSV